MVHCTNKDQVHITHTTWFKKVSENSSYIIWVSLYVLVQPNLSDGT